MRPVSRKPVGSGMHSPPPGDFVIPLVPSDPTDTDYMGYEPNPYHALSDPPPEREITTTTSAPQPQWQDPYETQHYNGSWHDTSEQFVYQQQLPQPSYAYPQSIISHRSQLTGDWDQSQNSIGATGANTTGGPGQIESVAPPHIHQEQAVEEEDDQAALGIGTGSEYIKRRRKAAGISCSRTMPKVLPIGIKATVSKQYTAPPAFVRKAMNIRYAHLPQRMLASEIDDEDVIPDSPIGRLSHDSNASPRIDQLSQLGQNPSTQSNLANQSLATVNTRSSLRKSTSSESVVEDIGKIKLFVANPDD